MSTRASRPAIRQRKLNTKQPLRIIREHEVEDAPDEEHRNIHQVETGVEKGEEVEFHLQAVINAASAAALGAKTEQSFIPTPEATKAKDVKYDQLYPKNFSQPATNIRFSSTVEDSIGIAYCMSETDAVFLASLNSGKDAHGETIKPLPAPCSEDMFEEVMNFLEETNQRLQPYAYAENAYVLSLEDIEQHREESLAPSCLPYLTPVYEYWRSQKGNRALMPAIKVRVLDTVSEADDADPYVCFRRREVRQTRKTRGRDAQVVEKLKKLRLELEQARGLVQMVRQREELNKRNLEISREVFEKRRQLKEVKITKNIVGEKGEDEDLLVNQKPVLKSKSRQDTNQQRPATIRIRSIGDRSQADSDLVSLEDLQEEAKLHVTNAVESGKVRHKRWNEHWQDFTWAPLTPPLESAEQPPKWAPLIADNQGYPTPPPSLPSRSSQERDGDIEMRDRPADEDTSGGADLGFNFFIPPPYPAYEFSDAGSFDLARSSKLAKQQSSRSAIPACRIRYGRGGRRHLEQRKPTPRAVMHSGVVSDGDSDDEADVYFPVSETKTFEYRCSTSRSRPDPGNIDRRQVASAEQYANAIAQANAAAQQSKNGQ